VAHQRVPDRQILSRDPLAFVSTPEGVFVSGAEDPTPAWRSTTSAKRLDVSSTRFHSRARRVVLASGQHLVVGGDLVDAALPLDSHDLKGGAECTIEPPV